MLVTGSGEQISELFDVETGNLIGRLHDHAGTVKTAEFSPENENLIVTGSRDGSIKLWDLRVVGVAADVFGESKQTIMLWISIHALVGRVTRSLHTDVRLVG